MFPSEFVGKLLDKATEKVGAQLQPKTKPSKEQAEQLNRLGILPRQINLLEADWATRIIARYEEWLKAYRRSHNNSAPASGRSRIKLMSLGYQQPIPLEISQKEISKKITEIVEASHPGDGDIDDMLALLPEGELNTLLFLLLFLHFSVCTISNHSSLSCDGGAKAEASANK